MTIVRTDNLLYFAVCRCSSGSLGHAGEEEGGGSEKAKGKQGTDQKILRTIGEDGKRSSREMTLPSLFFLSFFFFSSALPRDSLTGCRLTPICYYAESVSFLSLHISVKMEDGGK